MHILFLDTASADPFLGLCHEKQMVTLRALQKQGESHVMRILEEAFKDVQWRYEDHVNSQGERVAGLTHIACVVGPGGFVSSRVGITTANVLSHFLDIPLAGIHLSELWEARVRGHGTMDLGLGEEEDSFLWLHSTRRNLLFVRGFGEWTKQFPEPRLIEIEEAAKLEGQYIGELIEEHKKELSGCTPIAKTLLKPLSEVLPHFLAGLSYAKERILPWYGREA